MSLLLVEEDVSASCEVGCLCSLWRRVSLLPVEEGVSAPCEGGCLCSLWRRVSLLPVDYVPTSTSGPRFHTATQDSNVGSHRRDSTVQSSTLKPVRPTEF